MATSTARGREVELSVAVVPPSAAVSPPREHGARARHFGRHFGEMFVAMMVGMCGMGALEGLILSAAGTSVTHVRNAAPEVVGIVMALNMTVGMTLWMRHRRHSWAMCAEMAAAMLVPAVIAIALFWVGVLATGRSIGAVEMVVMVPAMIAVMLLRRKRVLRTRPQAGAGDREPKHLKPRGAGDNRCDGGSGRVPGPASSGSSR